MLEQFGNKHVAILAVVGIAVVSQLSSSSIVNQLTATTTESLVETKSTSSSSNVLVASSSLSSMVAVAASNQTRGPRTLKNESQQRADGEVITNEDGSKPKQPALVEASFTSSTRPLPGSTHLTINNNKTEEPSGSIGVNHSSVTPIQPAEELKTASAPESSLTPESIAAAIKNATSTDRKPEAKSKNTAKTGPPPTVAKDEPSSEKTAPSDNQQQSSTQKQLNVIVLYPDDMRHDSLSCAGNAVVKTPNLDRIASEGIRFTNNCVTTSICWISRATLFSGQYVSRHRAYTLRQPLNKKQWNDTYPAILRREANYFLGHIGKWQYKPFDHDAFDFAWLYEGTHIFKKKDGSLYHVTDRNEYDAIEFLRNQRPKDRKFALQVAFYAPKAVGVSDMQWTPKESSKHLYENLTIRYPPGMNESYARLPHFFHNDRIEGRKRWQQRFGTPQKYDASMKAYYRMITEVDAAIGKIYAELENQGILNETMIIFTTDNGFFHSEHGLSGKWYPYQESIRVPLIIRDPRMPSDRIGTTNDDFTLNIDLASTILGAAGLESHPRMQGRDIADLYLQKTVNPPWRHEFFYEFPTRGRSVIPQANALVRKDFKYFKYSEWKTEQLFDMKKDPNEEYDVSKDPKYADVMNEMRAQYIHLKAKAY